MQIVLTTDPGAGDLADQLAYIYNSIYVETVIKNPLYLPGKPFKSAPVPVMTVCAQAALSVKSAKSTTRHAYPVTLNCKLDAPVLTSLLPECTRMIDQDVQHYHAIANRLPTSQCKQTHAQAGSSATAGVGDVCSCEYFTQQLNQYIQNLGLL